MERNVPDAVRQATTQCRFDFSCLSSDRCGAILMCPIDRIVGDSFAFLAKQELVFCSYCLSFGGRPICMCPTRLALHRQQSN